MEYPARLLPHREYGIFSSDEIQSDWMVIRRTSVDTPDQLVVSESLSQYLGLSVSLCGVFLPEDITLVPSLKPGAPVEGLDDDWIPGSPCFDLAYISCCVDRQRHPTLLPVAKWHRMPFPIQKDNLKGRMTDPLQGRVEIEHRPTNVNYWHCEVTFKQEAGVPIKSTKKTWQRRVVLFVISSLNRPGYVITDPASVSCGTVEPVVCQSRK